MRPGALGLRVNLAANWQLLEETGTSTSARRRRPTISPPRRTRSVRRRRLAASAGYVGTEVVKEVPYYGGAFGAALTDPSRPATRSSSSAGANLGAALYEYGARAPHARLPAQAASAGRALDQQHYADFCQPSGCTTKTGETAIRIFRVSCPAG